jgi:hypothetical protein
MRGLERSIQEVAKPQRSERIYWWHARSIGRQLQRIERAYFQTESVGQLVQCRLASAPQNCSRIWWVDVQHFMLRSEVEHRPLEWFAHEIQKVAGGPKWVKVASEVARLR